MFYDRVGFRVIGKLSHDTEYSACISRKLAAREAKAERPDLMADTIT